MSVSPSPYFTFLQSLASVNCVPSLFNRLVFLPLGTASRFLGWVFLVVVAAGCPRSFCLSLIRKSSFHGEAINLRHQRQLCYVPSNLVFGTRGRTARFTSWNRSPPEGNVHAVTLVTFQSERSRPGALDNSCPAKASEMSR